MEHCLHPDKKPKHVRQDLSDLCRKAESDYVDFQEAGSSPITRYIVSPDLCR